MSFRISPSLGPDVEQVGPYYWDLDEPRPTYQIGSKVVGSDGRNYIHVLAGASNIAANTAINVNATTFVATAGAGPYTTTTAVLAGQPFHARVTALA